MSWGVMAGQLGWGGGLIDQEGWRKGPWTADEDRLLIEYVRLHGEGRWNSVARLAGLKRNGKSCRLRWVNYLRPDLKRGQITPHEESIILELHARWGNRWSTIARSLPGRTDNEIKNYWRTHFKKKAYSKLSPQSSSDKARNRFLKRQQFQQQQQQQMQQQDLQLNLKKIMSLLDVDNENKAAETAAAAAPYVPEITRQEMAAPTYPNATYDHHYYGLFSNMFNTNAATVPEVSAWNEEFLWDSSLWNLEDVHCYGNNNNSGMACATGIACSMQQHNNLVTPFC